MMATDTAPTLFSLTNGLEFTSSPPQSALQQRPAPQQARLVSVQRDPETPKVASQRSSEIERRHPLRADRLTITVARAVTSAGHASSAALRPQTTPAAGCWAGAAPPAAAAQCPPTLQAFTSQRTAQTSFCEESLAVVLLIKTELVKGGDRGGTHV